MVNGDMNQKMRIAMFSWESLHSIAVGGIAPHVTELAAALQRAGNEVHVFTRMGNGQQQYEVIEGVHYHRCSFDSNPNFIHRMDNMSRSFVYHFFQAENVSGNFDVIHGHDWMTANALAEIGNARNNKTVFTLHSTEYGRCGNVFHDGQSKDIRNLEWYGGFVADKIITTSETIKKEAEWIYKFGDRKIAVIPNGILLQKFDGVVDPWKSVKKEHDVGVWDPVCLFVGRMVVQKGVDLLLEAIPSVLAGFPTAKFFFIGDGYMRSGLEQRAKELGVQHACRFLGYVPDGELVNFYKACDVVCIPSRNEPFGIVVLEAWAAGKPIVVTHNGFDFVRHDVNGLKVYDNPGSIAWGIKSVFGDLEKAKRIGANGRKTAEGFSWDNIARMTMSVYVEDGENRFSGRTEEVKEMEESGEYRALIEELKAKNAELDRFAYAVSHDLKSPLITIQSFVDILREDLELKEAEKVESDLKYIENAATRMGHQLEDTLELSRSGRVVHPPKDVPFVEIVQEALEQTSVKLKSNNIEVSVADDFPTVHADKAKLVEALVNLIDNGINYMGEQSQPKIYFGYCIRDNETVFFVRDNCMGIEPGQHEKVFDLFYQVNKHGKGTGVGLAIVKRIIEVHGGRIWIKSEKGKGCTVCFTLPVRSEEKR